MLARGNGLSGNPRRAATRTPLARTRTPARAGRGNRLQGTPRHRWRPPRSLRTTPAAPAPGRCGVAGSPLCSRMAPTSTASVMKTMIRITATHLGQVKGNAS